MSVTLHVDQTRTEGLIGASDAAGILGLDRFKPPIFHWRRLRGEDVNDALPESVQEAARWGQALEPIVRGRYALDTNSRVLVPVSSFMRDAWLRATPDGVVLPGIPAGSAVDYLHALAEPAPAVAMMPADFDSIDPKWRQRAGMLQVKTCSAWLADEWEGAPPASYEVQCRVEMAVCGLPWDDLVCLIGGQRMVTHRIHRDMEIEARILGDLHAFWRRVKDGVEPEVDGSDAWRDYASMKMRKNAVEMLADEDIEDDLTRWKEVRRVRKQCELDEATIKTRMLLKLSAAGATRIKSSRGPVSAYQTGGRTDWKGYAASLGGDAKPPEKFVKPSATWALRSPFGNEDD